MRLPSIALLGLLGSLAVAPVSAETGDRWLVYEGTGGPGDGVPIVLISGDEEYRSEEALPQLAAILAFPTIKNLVAAFRDYSHAQLSAQRRSPDTFEPVPDVARGCPREHDQDRDDEASHGRQKPLCVVDVEVATEALVCTPRAEALEWGAWAFAFSLSTR